MISEGKLLPLTPLQRMVLLEATWRKTETKIIWCLGVTELVYTNGINYAFMGECCVSRSCLHSRVKVQLKATSYSTQTSTRDGTHSLIHYPLNKKHLECLYCPPSFPLGLTRPYVCACNSQTSKQTNKQSQTGRCSAGGILPGLVWVWLSVNRTRESDHPRV